MSVPSIRGILIHSTLSTRPAARRPITAYRKPIHHSFPFATTTPTLSTMPVKDSVPDVTADVSGEHNVKKFKEVSRDFRSDTLTIPTDAQLLVSLRATRGDAVYEEDEDTRKLEERVARMCGKEAALFCASGTMTNQLAIRTHMKQPPHSIIVDHRAHVHKMEAGGIAMFSQATTHQLFPSAAFHLTADDIRPALQLGTNIHIAPTRLICIENTLSGTVHPQKDIVEIGEMAREHGIAMHLDGARIWNVAAKVIEEQGMDPTSEEDRTKALTSLLEPFDTASLCLSKGIGAPIGSMIVGPREFIDRAKWFRKAFGGGVRQSGAMAAMADYAITHHFPRLQRTHALARRLAEGLKGLGCDIVAPVDTNMVFYTPTPIGLKQDAVAARLAGLPEPISVLLRERCVVHHQTSPQAIEEFIATVAEMKREVEQGKGAEVNAERDQLSEEERRKGKEEGKLRTQGALGY